MNPETRAGTQKPRKGVPYKLKGNGKVKIAGKMPALQIPRRAYKCNP
jgi:hypothetical protein